MQCVLFISHDSRSIPRTRIIYMRIMQKHKTLPRQRVLCQRTRPTDQLLYYSTGGSNCYSLACCVAHRIDYFAKALTQHSRTRTKPVINMHICSICSIYWDMQNARLAYTRMLTFCALLFVSPVYVELSIMLVMSTALFACVELAPVFPGASSMNAYVWCGVTPCAGQLRPAHGVTERIIGRHTQGIIAAHNLQLICMHYHT